MHVAPIYIPLKLKDSTYYLNFALWEDFFSFNQVSVPVHGYTNRKYYTVCMHVCGAGWYTHLICYLYLYCESLA